MALEIEAKFAVNHLADLRREIIDLGGRLLHDRTLERNWRYDRADGELTIKAHVLRLRQDDRTTLTYKSPAGNQMSRQEIELEVTNAETAGQFLQALGFEVIAIYEKYRETLILDDVEIALDELPFGSFVELEADSPDGLERAAKRLALVWDRRLLKSYLELFDQLAANFGLTARQATFEAFTDLPRVTAKQLGIQLARTAPGTGVD